MAGYKKPCIHCGTLIDQDARFCTTCFSRNPFGYLCPSCLHPVERGQPICASCGRPLYVTCPFCGQPTFVDDRCERCGQSLLIQCANRRCGQWQFFQNTKCTACGKPIKTKKSR
ncbi:MAG: hypothetical protein GX839_04920 [Fastidiosipila sp.]|nr:hypothetical protein [Fastidiosipila sp.]